MARSKKPKNPKREVFQKTTAMFPSLHEDVLKALHYEPIHPTPWFSPAGSGREAIEEYDTHIMGRFECRNENCPQKGWGSKKISILIRRFPDNGYNAVVFKQRCKSCEELGVLRLDEKCYVERVKYRLRKWAGIAMPRPEYHGINQGPEHEYDLCEGCKQGRCYGLSGLS